MTAADSTVQAIFDEMASAWNRADSAAYGELFTEDADFVEIRGGHHVGRQAIAGGHHELWQTIYRGSTVEYRVEAVRRLDRDHLVGIIGATMRAPMWPLAGARPARITAVVTRDADRWRIASFHNTLVVETMP